MSPGDVSTYNTYVLYLLAVVEVNVCVYLVSFLFEMCYRWLQVNLQFKCALSHYLLDSYVECTRLKMARGHLSCILN